MHPRCGRVQPWGRPQMPFRLRPCRRPVLPQTPISQNSRAYPQRDGFQRRTFMQQSSSINRIFRMQMANDLKRVGTVVFLPPVLALSYITAFGIVGFIGSQLWLEYVDMRREAKARNVLPPIHTNKDHKDLQRNGIDWGWGWDYDCVATNEGDWSGGPNGGTDSSLGLGSRVSVRLAWWFNQAGDQMGRQEASPSTSTGKLSSVTSPTYLQRTLIRSAEGAYALAEKALRSALIRVMARHPDRPPPLALMMRHAEILQKLGSPVALLQAKKDVNDVYNALTPGSWERRKAAYLLGGLCFSTGQTIEASINEAMPLWLEALPKDWEDGDARQSSSPRETRHISNVALQISTALLLSPHSTVENCTQTKIYDRLKRLWLADYKRMPSGVELKLQPALEDVQVEKIRLERPDIITEDFGEASLHLQYLAHRKSAVALNVCQSMFERAFQTGPDALETVAAMLEQSALTSVTYTPPITADSADRLKAFLNLGSLEHNLSSPSLVLDLDYATSAEMRLVAEALLRDSLNTAMTAFYLEGITRKSTRKSGSTDARAKAATLLAFQRAHRLTELVLANTKESNGSNREVSGIRSKTEMLIAQLELE